MTDTVIIGAGLTGLAAAYYFEKAGYTDCTDYLLVAQGR